MTEQQENYVVKIGTWQARNEEEELIFNQFNDECEKRKIGKRELMIEAIKAYLEKKEPAVKVADKREIKKDAEIFEYVQSLIEFNKAATKEHDLIAITRGYLKSNGGVSGNGFNHKAVKRFFDDADNAAMIEHHHSDVGIKEVEHWNKVQAKVRAQIERNHEAA